MAGWPLLVSLDSGIAGNGTNIQQVAVVQLLAGLWSLTVGSWNAGHTQGEGCLLFTHRSAVTFFFQMCVGTPVLFFKDTSEDQCVPSPWGRGGCCWGILPTQGLTGSLETAEFYFPLALIGGVMSSTALREVGIESHHSAGYSIREVSTMIFTNSVVRLIASHTLIPIVHMLLPQATGLCRPGGLL